MSRAEILNKLDDILDNARVNELLGRKKEEEKKCDKLLWIFAIIWKILRMISMMTSTTISSRMRKTTMLQPLIRRNKVKEY